MDVQRVDLWNYFLSVRQTVSANETLGIRVSLSGLFEKPGRPCAHAVFHYQFLLGTDFLVRKKQFSAKKFQDIFIMIYSWELAILTFVVVCPYIVDMVSVYYTTMCPFPSWPDTILTDLQLATFLKPFSFFANTHTQMT